MLWAKTHPEVGQVEDNDKDEGQYSDVEDKGRYPARKRVRRPDHELTPPAQCSPDHDQGCKKDARCHHTDRLEHHLELSQKANEEASSNKGDDDTDAVQDGKEGRKANEEHDGADEGQSKAESEAVGAQQDAGAMSMPSPGCKLSLSISP